MESPMQCAIKGKAEALSNKMNAITEKFKKNLDIADELNVSSSDIIEYVEETLDDFPSKVDSSKYSETYLDLLNLDNLVQDFNYIRGTLKENTEQGRKIIASLTVELLSLEPEEISELVISYAELNKALTDNMKLFINSYKEVSNIIINLEKVKNGFNKIQNTLNVTTINDDTNIIKTTAEIINSIRENRNGNSKGNP